MGARGTGSVYQRGSDKRWVAAVRDENTGKRRALYGRSRDAVLAKAQLAGVRTLPPPAALTVSQWLERWLAGLTLRPKTVAGYASKIRCITKVIGAIPLNDLSPDDVERAYRWWLDEGLSASSVRHIHRVLHRALRIAHRRGLVERNVTEMVDTPHMEQPEFTPLTASQTRAVLDAARDVPNGVRWWLALLLGMRQGECLGLQWSDVNLETRTLTVRRTLQRLPGRGLVVLPPKTTKSRRALPLPPPIPQMLVTQGLLQEAERALAGERWTVSDFVFTQPSGRPIRPEQDWRDWRALLEECGLPKVRVHDARHTAATLLFELGVPARVVAQILGHSTTKLTLDTYTHVDDPAVRAALDKLAEFISLKDEPER